MPEPHDGGGLAEMTIGRFLAGLGDRNGQRRAAWSLSGSREHDWREALPGWRGKRSYRPAYVAGALFFIGYPLLALLRSSKPEPEIILGTAGWTLFVISLFMQRTSRAAAAYGGLLPLTISLVITAIGAGLVVADRSAAFTVLFYYAGIASIRVAPERRALTTLTAIAIVAGLATSYSVHDLGEGAVTAFSIGLISLTIFSLAALTRAYSDLHAARQELATLAVAEERNRIARDLHDTLGHSLSVIALKTDLASRLLPPDPALERVRGELGETQTVAREALQSVRETISGYRQPTLEREIAGARAALETAGIDVTVAAPEGSGGLPPGVDAVLAWAVREGATNVLRHGHARRASISIGRSEDWATAEVINDESERGRGPVAALDATERIGPARPGTGISGLRERVAALGGTCDAGRIPGGGFRLSVRVPVGEDA